MKAIIIGAGPAGLTAAYELLCRTSIVPIVLEASDQVGGLSQTVNYRGNRIDIGGHRFFSKSDRVMDWWLQFLPLQALPKPMETIFYQGKPRPVSGSGSAPDPARDERVMLLRPRRSRIYYLNKLFPYPIEPSFEMLFKLGLARSLPHPHELPEGGRLSPQAHRQPGGLLHQPLRTKALRDVLQILYGEGLGCLLPRSQRGVGRAEGQEDVDLEGAVARVSEAAAVRRRRDRGRVETSLIEQFLYPKYGPGQMWETVAAEVNAEAGESCDEPGPPDLKSTAHGSLA